ncbi:glycine betaine ABC transporter substrate-binding protein [Streptomyces aidingensis]|uniref:Glycine betaine/proline transport system substrate-binding protein n=1 Tax=Streptomyces aidingensis TaxID=910347 RepID=A0A1I1EG84_9ACTN|nr:glycine betaine ABC transporter substrate-binding protein [Streptomyces aidingensis]SFB85612.1 glycine betaine/proline transport system substrate-binding protein [Streptomyces aidingensis]
MRKRTPARRTALAAGTGVLALLALTACGAAETDRPDAGGQDGGSDNGGEGQGYDTVVIAEPNWVGAAANVAVAKHVLETELDVTVEVRQIDETLAWDGLDDGSIHAILEDWGGAPEKEELYLEEKKSVVPGGELGVVGHIGWFVPKAYADAHPEVKTWEGLNDLAEDFRTAESGDKGQLLNGDPGYTSYDKEIVRELGLDFQVVEAGSEEALISAIQRADREGTPLLTYWWTPHWLNAEVELVEVELPPYSEECYEDLSKVACAYPDVNLPKYLNADFAENGGEAAEFLKNFQWDTADQELVAQLIQGEGMEPEAAAEQWVAQNPDKVQAWLPAEG